METKNVLVVDSNLGYRTVVKFTFKRPIWKLGFVNSLFEAIDRLDERHSDAVIIDVQTVFGKWKGFAPNPLLDFKPRVRDIPVVFIYSGFLGIAKRQDLESVSKILVHKGIDCHGLMEIVDGLILKASNRRG